MPIQEQLKLSQRQRAALQGVQERLLESVARLASQRSALTSELQVCLCWLFHRIHPTICRVQEQCQSAMQAACKPTQRSSSALRW